MTRDDSTAVFIGERNIWGETKSFGLTRPDRRHHMYCLGKTGSGKTTLLRNLILQDIEAGEGVGVIDPHGDLSEDLLDHIPPSRTDDVVYFNPADTDYPIGFNLLRTVPKDVRHLVASGFVSALKSIWRDSWGPRLEYILYAAAAALLDCENASVLGIQRMLADEHYRAWVVKQVKDPIVRSFWRDEFDRYDRRFLTEAIAPIQNKVGQLLMAPPIRNVFGQIKTKIDPAFMMDDRRIFIANLSKGKLGPDKAGLIGAVLVTQFQLAAMARAGVPEDKREDFYLYIDELHNFSTDSFASLLSESRKYRLCLTLSHQYSAQLREEVRDAVFGNVGTVISFRVGEADGHVLQREFGENYPARHFTELGNFEVCVKLLADGQHNYPFTGKTFSPFAQRYGRRENIIRRSREKYATPRLLVEDRIDRWMGGAGK
jgi:Type IV secretion-system coupling protein DNA-binding domain